MGEKSTLNLDQTQSDGLQRLIEEGQADSYSEAGRIAINAGLVELGYLNGTKTKMGWLAREIAKLFAMFGVAWLGFTLFYPVTLRIWTVFFFGAALASYAVAELSERGVFQGILGGEPV